jgi:hypothetical protein
MGNESETSHSFLTKVSTRIENRQEAAILFVSKAAWRGDATVGPSGGRWSFQPLGLRYSYFVQSFTFGNVGALATDQRKRRPIGEAENSFMKSQILILSVKRKLHEGTHHGRHRDFEKSG